MSSDFDLNDLRRRMQGAVDVLKTEFSGLRTGRASASMIEPVQVNMYGSIMPLNQCASINVPEPRLLTVQVWDMNAVSEVEKAIRDSGLGLNPQTEGAVIRIPVPELNEERRQELTKVAGKYAEQSRVSVRNVRRDGMDTLKRMEKDGELSEDEHKRKSDEVQKLTDEIVSLVDSMLEEKEKDIMTI
jgi:ribosome recycling factor